ncbi:hypothetical protein DQG23_02825 [Paenibacillus contaminans]|uniref:HTH araC/xylS-type domain-containing protein n=2 Tax=Paenibacillus contaminans TaxID=450362 RepID=A0A329MWE6_9BACL|nr:hypothetical protein DQG23_02825 [Paenibacillus contaminans]
MGIQFFTYEKVVEEMALLKTLPSSLHKNSLFTKLLTGFIMIITLLFSFNFFSFPYFSRNVQKEIIVNNQQNLSATVERYENHILIVKGAITRLFSNEKVVLMNELGNGTRFDPVNQIVDEIKSILSNDLLYLDNIVLQFRKNGFIIDKNGTSTTGKYFTKNYASKDYGIEFWEEQLELAYPMKIGKRSEFIDKFNGRSNGSFIPIIFKNDSNAQLFIAVFLDPVKMHNAFHNSNQNRFYVINDDKLPLFASLPEPVPDFPLLTEMETYIQDDDLYYFYKKGALTGLTYLAVIPNGNIAAQVSRIISILVVFLVAAVVLSVVISVVFSIKFNNPIRKMMQALQRFHPVGPLSSNIREYNFLYDNIKRMIRINREIHTDLDQKKRQLKNLHYLYKLKKINNNLDSDDEAFQPFYLIVFQLAMTPRYYQLVASEQDRASYFIKEFVSIALADKFADSVTMQIEQDQILSLVFADNNQAERLMETLHELKRVFDQDEEYCYLTIAMRPQLCHPAEFAEAYGETSAMVHRRKPKRRTQIIAQMPHEPKDASFTPAEEQQFLVQLQAGNRKIALELVSSILNRMNKNEATAGQYVEFAKEIIAKSLKTLTALELDISMVLELNAPYLRIKECLTPDEFEDFCKWFLTEALLMIQDRQDGIDPVKQFMTEYLHEHCDEDLSLEMMAGKINMSANYFSKYFKEKIGMNFTEYLTELRIRKAKNLLVESDQKIQHIAEQVGYVNVNSFIRMFKKVTGTTPGEYKRIHQLGR